MSTQTISATGPSNPISVFKVSNTAGPQLPAVPVAAAVDIASATVTYNVEVCYDKVWTTNSHWFQLDPTASYQQTTSQNYEVAATIYWVRCNPTALTNGPIYFGVGVP